MAAAPRKHCVAEQIRSARFPEWSVGGGLYRGARVEAEQPLDKLRYSGSSALVVHACLVLDISPAFPEAQR